MDSSAFDADALQFLEELVDADFVASTPDAEITLLDHHHDLLSRPLHLPLLPATPATPAEIATLDFFPLSDDDDSNQHTTLARENANPKAPASSTPSPSTTLKAKRKKPNRSANYDPNRARNLRRHELVYLRDKVSEMEQELVRLREATTASPVVQDPLLLQAPPEDEDEVPGSAALTQSPPTGETMWERIAARQLNERRRAERENARLKIVLETQLKIAKSLERLLHKRTTLQGFDTCGHGLGQTPPRRMYTSSASASDTDIFASLLAQVHECYVNAASHFTTFGIATSESSCRDARVRERANESGLKMEIFANDVLPFPVHAAGQAAWQYFSHYKNQLPYRLYYERLSENMDLPEDTIVENSGLELTVSHTKAIFNIKQVIRRYVDAEDRVVIAYSAIAQPVEFANKPVWGFDFREWGCMVLTKPETLDADAYCVLKSCYFITPHFHNAGAVSGDEDDGDREAIIGDLTEFVLSSTAATMGAWLQMIENILVVEQAGAAPPR